jgi:phage nucleotide-binding protein
MAVALIYGRSGAGKTVNSSLVKTKKRGKNLLLNSDGSHFVLKNFNRPNLDIQPIEHWMEQSPDGKAWLSLRKQFSDAIASKKYDCIIVDNVSDVFDLAVLEMDASGRFADPRKYYLLIYNDLKRLSREAQNADCDIIFTGWTSEFEAKLEDGSLARGIRPKLPEKILDNFLGLCNIVAYIQTGKDKEGNKRWYYHLTGSGTLYAKDQLFCRKNCMPEDIFTEAINEG